MFVNDTEIPKFKGKDSEIVAAPICLENISKDRSADNMKKIELNNYVYDFSIDPDAIAVDNILDIHKYLMKKNNMIRIKMFGFIKKIFLTGLTVLSYLNPLSATSLSCI